MASLPVLSYVVGAIGVAAHGAYIGSEGIPIYSTPKERPSCETAFEYHGCAVVDLNGFSDPINIPNERLTHETCQVACEGNQIVAIFADSCRCGNDPDAFEATDPSVCDNPCSGDPNLGMCGSQCPQNGKEISTIYIAIEKPPVDPIDGKALDPSISPTVAVNPLPIPDTTESRPQIAPVPSDDPVQAQITESPPIPPPKALQDPLSRAIVTKSEPDIITQSLKPSSVRASPEETVPEDDQNSARPTPSRVLMANACLHRFNGWSLAGGLLFFLLVVA